MNKSQKIFLKEITMNNLQNISPEIPLNKLVAVVGPSGSGKSSLIYEVLYKSFLGGLKFDISNIPKIHAMGQKTFVNERKSIEEISKKIKKGELLIVDEPCAGLEKSERIHILESLTDFVKKGISVIAIEHSNEIILGADYVLEFGPGSGVYGGKLIFQGNQESFRKSNTKTAEYILKNKAEKVIYERNPSREAKLMQNKRVLISKINKNELDNFNFEFPLGGLVCIHGKTGAGKLTLLRIVYCALFKGKNAWKERKYLNKGLKISGKENVRRSYFIDQTSIKAGSNSSVATYSKLSSELRKITEDFDILTVDEAIKKFSRNSLLKRKLEFLREVGLGYLELGQKTNTLSGGEAQRLKLSRVLSKKLGDRCIYLFNNPSRGLHPSDLPVLLKVFQKIIDKNNTILVAENREEIIKNSDYAIELK